MKNAPQLSSHATLQPDTPRGRMRRTREPARVFAGAVVAWRRRARRERDHGGNGRANRDPKGGAQSRFVTNEESWACGGRIDPMDCAEEFATVGAGCGKIYYELDVLTPRLRVSESITG